ncbi:MAG: isochorismatase family protein [Nitrospinota bacterium]
MREWDRFLTPIDKEVYDAAGFMQKGELGERPAVLVVDVVYNFVGERPEPILKSIEKYHHSCGELGWEGVYRIRELLEAARARGVPIIYSTNATRSDGVDLGRWAAKNRRASEPANRDSNLGFEIVKEVAPEPHDIVLPKLKPSFFFGTPLVSLLRGIEVDTLLVTGTTTSGCVRATVIDAFSYEFKVAVVEECVFDRGEVSHAINLFDMNAKYADVILLKEAKAYLERVPARQVPLAETPRA